MGRQRDSRGVLKTGRYASRSGGAVQAQAVRLGIPTDERVRSRQLLLPCRRRRADSAQVLQQVPEAGNGVPLCGRHQLSRQRRGRRGVAAAGGVVGGLPGLEQASGQLAAATIHGCQTCQANSVPHSGVHASRVAHEPELLPGGLLGAQLSSQGGPHGGGHRAVPEVVAAVGVWGRGAAGAGLRAAAMHARREGEAVEHEAPIHLLVLVLPRQLPHAWQQARDLAAVGYSWRAWCCKGLQGRKTLQPLLLQA